MAPFVSVQRLVWELTMDSWHLKSKWRQNTTFCFLIQEGGTGPGHPIFVPTEPFLLILIMGGRAVFDLLFVWCLCMKMVSLKYV